MITVKVDVNKQKLEQKIKSIGPLTKRSLVQVGKLEVISTQNRIANTKASPTGQAWAPWSMATLRARTLQGTAHQGLLYRTGELFRSIYYKVTNTTLEVGSRAHYAQFLQQGTSKMPGRPFIGFTQNSINILRRLFATDLNR